MPSYELTSSARRGPVVESKSHIPRFGFNFCQKFSSLYLYFALVKEERRARLARLSPTRLRLTTQPDLLGCLPNADSRAPGRLRGK